MSRKTGGAVARWAGDNFEQWNAAQLTMAQHQGIIAWWRHISPRVRWVGRGGKVHPVVTGEAAADYVGQLVGGRAFVIEAKTRRLADGSFYQREVEPQQLAHLQACAQGGGLALLVIEFRTEALQLLRYAVPWLETPWQKKNVGLFINPDVLAGWGVEPNGLYLNRFIKEPPPTQSIRAAAAYMGRAGGLVGGPARAKALSGDLRTAIAKKAADARWKKAEGPHD